MFRGIALALLLAGCQTTPAPVIITPPLAEPAAVTEPRVCNSYAEMGRILDQDYGESGMWRGISKNGYMAQIWTADDGTWTLLLISPQGVACLVDSGGNSVEMTRRGPGV